MSHVIGTMLPFGSCDFWNFRLIVFYHYWCECRVHSTVFIEFVKYAREQHGFSKELNILYDCLVYGIWMWTNLCILKVLISVLSVFAAINIICAHSKQNPRTSVCLYFYTLMLIIFKEEVWISVKMACPVFWIFLCTNLATNGNKMCMKKWSFHSSYHLMHCSTPSRTSNSFSAQSIKLQNAYRLKNFCYVLLAAFYTCE